MKKKKDVCGAVGTSYNMLYGEIQTPTIVTAANPTEKLTLDVLQKIKEKLNKDYKNTKILIIYFCNWIPEDSFYEGSFINDMLNCKENEKGCIIPISYKKVIKNKFKGVFGFSSFSERTPEQAQLQRLKEIHG